MSSVLWFVIIGALFFWMMRRGCCGAHAGGHGTAHGGGGSHENEPHGDEGWTVEDPVCGAKGPADSSRPSLEHDGRMYYFCSEACRDLFIQDPSRYLSESTAAGARHDG
jgi:Cu+-exporting ATPase